MLMRRLCSDDQIEPELESSSDIEDRLSENINCMQTFVFSATLSKDLQRNVKMRLRPKSSKDKTPSTLG